MRRISHPLDADDLESDKSQVSPVMNYAQLRWLSGVRSHLNLLDKLQRCTSYT